MEKPHCSPLFAASRYGPVRSGPYAAAATRRNRMRAVGTVRASVGAGHIHDITGPTLRLRHRAAPPPGRPTTGPSRPAREGAATPCTWPRMPGVHAGVRTAAVRRAVTPSAARSEMARMLRPGYHRMAAIFPPAKPSGGARRGDASHPGAPSGRTDGRGVPWHMGAHRCARHHGGDESIRHLSEALR
jgi:hypothetical protein